MTPTSADLAVVGIFVEAFFNVPIILIGSAYLKSAILAGSHSDGKRMRLVCKSCGQGGSTAYSLQGTRLYSRHLQKKFQIGAQREAALQKNGHGKSTENPRNQRFRRKSTENPRKIHGKSTENPVDFPQNQRFRDFL
jgi:hypothetical protein